MFIEDNSSHGGGENGVNVHSVIWLYRWLPNKDDGACNNPYLHAYMFLCYHLTCLLTFSINLFVDIHMYPLPKCATAID